jgi:hypothetical protein
VKELLGYGLAVAGLIFSGLAFAAIAGRQKYAVTKPMILYMLRSAPFRAEIMCKAGKGSFLEAVGAAIKTGAMMRSQDLSIVVQGTRPAYDAAAPMLVLHWKSVVKRARAGVVLAAGSIVLAISADASPIVHILATILCVISGVMVLLYKLDVDRSIVLARAEVVPEVERMFVEGRYALPPLPAA